MIDKIMFAKDVEKVNKMQAMRIEGYTYREIADFFNVSKQDVHQILNCAKKRHLRNDKIRNAIIYRGIYEYFTANPKMNFTEFTRRVYHIEKPDYRRVNKLTRFIEGDNVFLPIDVYKSICKVCESTFEKVFEYRGD